jgi:hypothetical protein
MKIVRIKIHLSWIFLSIIIDYKSIIIKIINPIILQQNRKYNRLKSDFFKNYHRILIDDNLIIIDYNLILICKKIGF